MYPWGTHISGEKHSFARSKHCYPNIVIGLGVVLFQKKEKWQSFNINKIKLLEGNHYKLKMHHNEVL